MKARSASIGPEPVISMLATSGIERGCESHARLSRATPHRAYGAISPRAPLPRRRGALPSADTPASGVRRQPREPARPPLRAPPESSRRVALDPRQHLADVRPELVAGRPEEAGHDHAQRPARRLRAEDLERARAGHSCPTPTSRCRSTSASTSTPTRSQSGKSCGAATASGSGSRRTASAPLGLPRGRRSGARRRRSRFESRSLPLPQRAAAAGACERSIAVGVAALPDVLRHETLERLELLEQLLRRNLTVGLTAPEDPRRRLHRRAPSRLVGVCAGARLRPLRSFGDCVEVDVLEAVAFLLVERDVSAAALELRRRSSDRRPESRVLAPLVVTDHVAGLARAGLDLLDLLDENVGLHGGGVPARRVARAPRRCSGNACSASSTNVGQPRPL